MAAIGQTITGPRFYESDEVSPTSLPGLRSVC